MARTKASPIQREPSSEYSNHKAANGNGTGNGRNVGIGNTKHNPQEQNVQISGSLAADAIKSLVPEEARKEGGALQYLIAVGGIYGSFLTWAVLQERLTTTSYGPTTSPELFKFPVFLNTVQSLFAAMSGYLYLLSSTPKGAKPAPLFPSSSIVLSLLMVAITSSLASPFGYASLAHLDYITFILAKSCKLLPVMFLQITLFRQKYPLYKYLVVLAVTSGVAVFTLHAGSGKAHSKPSKASLNPDKNATWGILLLTVNLLFDGLTNTTQDWIKKTNKSYSGAQMMCAMNILSTLITFTYLGLSPYLVHTGIGEYLGMDIVSGGEGEFAAALGFMQRHPGVWLDVVGFSLCGAIGQVFIFYAITTMGSLHLVTITVTRKMITMIVSVLWFGHRLGGKQWMGVVLVFGAIGAEAYINITEKKGKARTIAKKEL